MHVSMHLRSNNLQCTRQATGCTAPMSAGPSAVYIQVASRTQSVLFRTKCAQASVCCAFYEYNSPSSLPFQCCSKTPKPVKKYKKFYTCTLASASIVHVVQYIYWTLIETNAIVESNKYHATHYEPIRLHNILGSCINTYTYWMHYSALTFIVFPCNLRIIFPVL